MKKLIIFVIVVGILYYIGSRNDSSSSTSSSSSSSNSSIKKCSWCGNEFTGDGYSHLFDGCVSGGSMCSEKCCMDSWNASHH